MDYISFATNISRAVPRLKNPVQLAGMIAALGFFYLGSVSSPPNLAVQLSGGLIFVSVIVFSVSLNVINQFPSSQRAKLVATLFLMFIGSMIVFMSFAVFMTVWSNSSATKARAAELSDAIRTKMQETAQQIDRTRSEVEVDRRLEEAAAGSTTTTMLDAVQRKKAAEQHLETIQRKLRLIQDLLQNLSAPNSELAGAIEAARDFLGLRSGRMSVISSAEASVIDGNLAPLVSVLEQASREMQVVPPEQRLYGAWVKRMQGKIQEANSEVAQVYEAYPDNPMAIETLADLNYQEGNFAKSAHLYDLLIAYYKDLKRSDMNLALALKDRATVARYGGDAASAKEYFKQARDVYDLSLVKDPIVLANIENDEGGLKRAEGDLVSAKRLHEEAIAYYRSPGASSYGFPQCLSNLGEVERLLLNLGSSIKALTESIEVQGRTTGFGTLFHGQTLIKLSRSQVESGAFAESERSARLAHTVLQRLNSKDFLQGMAELDRKIAVRFQGDASGSSDIVLQISNLVSLDDRDKDAVIERAIEASEGFRIWNEGENARSAIEAVAGRPLASASEHIRDALTIEQYATIALNSASTTQNQIEEFESKMSALADKYSSTGRPEQVMLFKISLARAGVAISRNENAVASQHLCQCSTLRKDFAEAKILNLLFDATLRRFVGPLVC